ncbi:MAG TPA: hypothetical protein VLH18_04400 [Candidatus Limnocylindrales bacterium]|nr:hypothetical protein [Candidatus Limnocylindrales bacterium]
MEYNKEDLFERLLKWTMRKWALSEQYPLHYAFLVKQLLDCPPDINLKVTEMRNEYKAQSLSLFMHNLDFSNLRQGISKQKALEVVFYVIEGLKERNIAKYKQNPRPLNELHNEILNDIKEYLDICRHGICNGRD